MAQHLAKIFGTEEDKVNCPFYQKMGACRHGDRCSRIHNRPVLSQTIMLQNFYLPPPQEYDENGNPIPQDEDMLQEHFEDFYEDIFEELTKIGGELEQLRACENLSDHLTGNVYAKFREEEDAERAFKALMGRFYGGRPILAQFCPVTDFKDARCRQFEESTCGRGGYCNFMHLKKVSSKLQRRLMRLSDEYRRDRERERGRDDRGRDDRGRDDRGRDRDDRGRDRDDRGRDRDDRGRDRERERDYDRRDRGRDDRGRDDRGRDERRRDDRDGGGARENSAERRAKIAAWNKSREGGGGGGGGGGGDGGGAREGSEERRAKIAEWNKVSTHRVDRMVHDTLQHPAHAPLGFFVNRLVIRGRNETADWPSGRS
ncbi:hypothetical protein AB1Y20_016725 [Prymnesium parvum]|uniref:Uncharacterized protein n=1 Tax=Prymnesium parvum TaxID=97485 RepID=A0AB34I945_PRYPA